jgi:hypothetical protein
MKFQTDGVHVLTLGRQIVQLADSLCHAILGSVPARSVPALPQENLSPAEQLAHKVWKILSAPYTRMMFCCDLKVWENAAWKRIQRGCVVLFYWMAYFWHFGNVLYEWPMGWLSICYSWLVMIKSSRSPRFYHILRSWYSKHDTLGAQVEKLFGNFE